MPDPNEMTFTVRDAQILYPNFEGRATQFKPQPGYRNFLCVLPEDVAKAMERDGWNVRYREPREDAEGEEGRWTIEIAVGFNFKPPRVVMITSSGRVNLDESTVGVLDWADIEKVDLIARSYEWEVGGNRGIKAYLKTMFVTIAEDELEREYGINDVAPAPPSFDPEADVT